MGEVDKKNLNNARGVKTFWFLRKRDLLGSWHIEIYLSSMIQASFTKGLFGSIFGKKMPRRIPSTHCEAVNESMVPCF